MKKFLNALESKIDFKSRLYNYFYHDFQKKTSIEVLLPVLIILIFIISNYFYYFNAKTPIILLFFIWAILALTGFFIPSIKIVHVLALPGKQPEKPASSIPILINLKAKGGLIAGRKIRFSAKIVDLEKGIDSKRNFKDTHDELSLVFFNSIAVPIKRGKFLEGSPSAGGIKITSDKYQDKADIMFNLPGEYAFKIITKKKNDPRQYMDELKGNATFTIKVSPSEHYISLRNYSITYSLTLIILLLTALQLKLI